MSKYLHYSVLALGACAAGAQAQTNVQFYGRLNVSAEYVKASAASDGPRLSQQRISNNRSVLGFRGSEDLGGGVSAIFQIEARSPPIPAPANLRGATPGLASMAPSARCSPVTGRPPITRRRPASIRSIRPPPAI